MNEYRIPLFGPNYSNSRIVRIIRPNTAAHLIGNLHRPGEDLLDVVQPAGRLQVGQPPLVLDVGEAHVLDLAQALPHHVDVVDVQEDKLGTLIVIFILISSSPTDHIEIEIIQI